MWALLIAAWKHLGPHGSIWALLIAAGERVAVWHVFVTASAAAASYTGHV